MGLTRRVESAGHEEQRAILDVEVLRRADDGVPDDREREEPEDDRSADLPPVRDEGSEDYFKVSKCEQSGEATYQ